MKNYYWAVRPISQREHGGAIRIERAATARKACVLAFGRGLGFPGSEPVWEAKNLGSRVRVIQTDAKRIALLTDPTGWEPIVP